MERFWYPRGSAQQTDLLDFRVDNCGRPGIFGACAIDAGPGSAGPARAANFDSGSAANSSPPPAQPSLEPTAPPQKTLAVVVLDPAHGGADSGARGSSGIAESEIVLSFARLMRISLEAQGLRVILTRQANDDPSFDDRSQSGERAARGHFHYAARFVHGPAGNRARVFPAADDPAAKCRSRAPLGTLGVGPRAIQVYRSEPQAGRADPDSDGAALSRLLGDSVRSPCTAIANGRARLPWPSRYRA